MPVHIKQGNVLEHTNPAIIPHVVNSRNGWGAGFVLSISQVNDGPQRQYHKWFKDGYCMTYSGDKKPFKFGNVQYCWLNPPDKKYIIANVLAQTLGEEEIPIKYWAVRKGLEDVKNAVRHLNSAEGMRYDVASPLLGCGLSKGKLEEIYSIVKDLFYGSPINYYLYAFSQKDFQKLQKVAKDFA